MALVDVGRVARGLNLDERRVQQLVKEGMPREGRGRYDAMKCMLWYIRYLQAVLERTVIPTDRAAATEERVQRLRKIRVDAELKEMEVARLRSTLVAACDVERETRRLASAVQARMLAVSARLAPEMVGETSRLMAQAKIEKALREALAQLAREGAT